MLMRRRLTTYSALLLLTGCGTYVPTISEPWEPTDPGNARSSPPTPPVTASGQMEFEIKKEIYCELWKAVNAADIYKVKVDYGNKVVESKYLPDNWGAQLSLSLEVDDNSALNPAVSFITPFSAMQSRTVGFGATLSSTSSRTDKFNSFFTVQYLRSGEAQQDFCFNPNQDPFVRRHITPSKSSFMASDLGIKEWLIDSLFVDRSIPSFGAAGSAPPQSSLPTAGQGSQSKDKKKSKDNSNTNSQDAISLEIKFIVVTSGDVNPSWKLIRVSADTGSSPLLSAGRTRTHDMILTIGPQTPQTDYANLALQIGQAVSSGNRAALGTP